MLFRSYTPRAPLCDFVEDFRMYENYTGAHLRERILPSGTFELVFNLRDDELRIYASSGASQHDQCRRFSGALISGPYAGSFVTDTEEEASILGVHFKPGGAFAVLGLPAGEFANAHVDLTAVWGPSASYATDCVRRRSRESAFNSWKTPSSRDCSILRPAMVRLGARWTCSREPRAA